MHRQGERARPRRRCRQEFPLVVTSAILLVAHQLYFWDIGPFTSPRWAVNGDRTFIEIFGYVQLAVAVVRLRPVIWCNCSPRLFSALR
jgi:hypothetical protein